MSHAKTAREDVIRKLARTECCNYADGKCIVLPDEQNPWDNKTCLITDKGADDSVDILLRCEWFTEAVLPLDKTMGASIKIVKSR